MPKHISSLDDISVSSPCRTDWESMSGDDHVRYCHHCNLNVHNLSALTQSEALRLVAKSKGRLCVRYYQRPDSTIQTMPVSARLHQIRRRPSRIAAGAFSAALGLCANVPAAQTLSPSNGLPPSSYQLILNREVGQPPMQSGSAVLLGTILDANEAVIPNATLTLVNEQTKDEHTASANDEGEYRFDSLEDGFYTLRVQAGGFAQTEITGISLQSGAEVRMDARLQVAETLSVGMGVVTISEPSEPLVKAAFENDLAAVKELLASGADVNVLDKDTDSTALAQAVSNGNRELVQLLLDAWADVNKQNRDGETALMYLNDRGSADVVRALLKAGSNLEIKDDDGETALIALADWDNADALKALIKAGARLDAKDEEGRTALMLAAKEGLVKNVKMLLEAGAEINQKDEDGWTALKHARDNGHEEVIELLLNKGAIE